MKPMSLILFTVAMMFGGEADAQYNYGGHAYNYCSTNYSGWTYRLYPPTNYYYRVRYVTNCGQQTLEHDTYLYRYENGCYHQHCKIADYAKPNIVLQPDGALQKLGSTDYGADALRYAVAKTYGPALAGYIQQQGIPSPVDVAALLPPLNTLRAAILESASKSNTSASELFAQVVSAEQATERQANELRAKLAMQVASLQSTERIIGQVKEIQAVAAQQATISATANADQIPIADPTLKQIVATSCFQCHGGGDVKAGLDFKQAATFGAKEWRAIRNAVISGRMPKGGQPLDDNQQQFFEDYYDRVRTGLSKPVGT